MTVHLYSENGMTVQIQLTQLWKQILMCCKNKSMDAGFIDLLAMYVNNKLIYNLYNWTFWSSKICIYSNWSMTSKCLTGASHSLILPTGACDNHARTYAKTAKFVTVLRWNFQTFLNFCRPPDAHKNVWKWLETYVWMSIASLNAGGNESSIRFFCEKLIFDCMKVCTEKSPNCVFSGFCLA